MPKDAGLVSDNPSSRLSRFYRESPSRDEEICPLTAEEVPKFLAAVFKHAGRYYALFLCAIHTGLRPRELAALEWGNLDFNGKFAMVRSTLVSGKVQNRTKTRKVRRIDLSEELIGTLLQH